MIYQCKKVCHEFVEKQGWIIAWKIYEKGVSGYKISETDWNVHFLSTF